MSLKKLAQLNTQCAQRGVCAAHGYGIAIVVDGLPPRRHGRNPQGVDERNASGIEVTVMAPSTKLWRRAIYMAVALFKERQRSRTGKPSEVRAPWETHDGTSAQLEGR